MITSLWKKKKKREGETERERIRESNGGDWQIAHYTIILPHLSTHHKYTHINKYTHSHTYTHALAHTHTTTDTITHTNTQIWSLPSVPLCSQWDCSRPSRCHCTNARAGGERVRGTGIQIRFQNPINPRLAVLPGACRAAQPVFGPGAKKKKNLPGWGQSLSAQPPQRPIALTGLCYYSNNHSACHSAAPHNTLRRDFYLPFMAAVAATAVALVQQYERV